MTIDQIAEFMRKQEKVVSVSYIVIFIILFSIRSIWKASIRTSSVLAKNRSAGKFIQAVLLFKFTWLGIVPRQLPALLITNRLSVLVKCIQARNLTIVITTKTVQRQPSSSRNEIGWWRRRRPVFPTLKFIRVAKRQTSSNIISRHLSRPMLHRVARRLLLRWETPMLAMLALLSVQPKKWGRWTRPSSCTPTSTAT